MVSKYQRWNCVRTMKHSQRQSIEQYTMIVEAVDSFAPLQCIDCELLSLVRVDATEPFLLSNYMKRWITGVSTNTLYYRSKCCCYYYNFVNRCKRVKIIRRVVCFLRCSLFVTETSPIVGGDVWQTANNDKINSFGPQALKVSTIVDQTRNISMISSNKRQRIDKRKWL